MVTIKLKKKSTAPSSGNSKPDRAPVRGAGSGVKRRPTLAEAQAQRAEREARYQEQLRQRFGDNPPPAFARRRPDGGALQGDAHRPPAHRSRDTAPPRNARQSRSSQDPPQGAPGNPRGGLRDEGRGQPRPERPPTDGVWPTGGNTAFGQRTAPPLKPRGQEYRATPGQSPRNTAHGPDTRRDDHRRSGGAARPAPPRRARDDDDHIHPGQPGSMRLSKRMSELGMASRREADEWIPKGWVRVDGRVVKELGSRVMPGQHITVDAKARNLQSLKVTVLINKPVGYVSGQAEDGYEPAAVLVTPQNQWREDRSGIRFVRTHLHSLAPAGRLDIDSVGLLVLTQDGRIAKQLIGESSEIDKEYLVRVQTQSGRPLPASDLALLNHGLELDGEALRPAQVEWVNDDQLRFVLREGKKRQIRRMCEAVGLTVLGLKRVRIGRVMLGDLPPGKWRYLRDDESFAATAATMRTASVDPGAEE